VNTENTRAQNETAQNIAGAYVDRLLVDADRFAAAVTTGPLDAPVAGCPGWDLEQLTRHMAHVHRWARHCVEHAERPAKGVIAEPEPGVDAAFLANWLREGASNLGAALRSADPESPTWHPFPVAKVTSVWARRQAHETSIHRWDAQHAVGTADPIDAAFASDGIDEFFTIALPRTVVREHLTPPVGSVHVHCTDVEGEWLAWFDDDGYHVVAEHRKGDAALRGPAEQLLLALYHRDGDRSELSPIGDEDVLTAWFELPGL
jgi:uncharacterized protein (TIGR03083 family)